MDDLREHTPQGWRVVMLNRLVHASKPKRAHGCLLILREANGALD
jgi:hypothetical protein